jgi:hypothetical protein
MPGQKIIRLAKKGGDPSFPDAGFRRFSPGISLPPRLFTNSKKGELNRSLPALFVFGACFFARATRRRVTNKTLYFSDPAGKITDVRSPEFLP